MSAPDDAIWTEVCGDEKRFFSITTYNDGNLANGDGCQGRCSYSISVKYESRPWHEFADRPFV